MNFIQDTSQLSHFLHVIALFSISVSALALIASRFASKKFNQFHNYNDNAYLARLLLVYIYFYEVKFKMSMHLVAAFFAITSATILVIAHYPNQTPTQHDNRKTPENHVIIVDSTDQKKQTRHDELLEAIKNSEFRSNPNSKKSDAGDNGNPIISTLIFFALFSSLYFITETPPSNSKKVFRIGALAIISAGITFSLFDRFNAIENFSPTFIKFDYHTTRNHQSSDDSKSINIPTNEMKVSCDEHLKIGPFKTGSSSELEGENTLSQRVNEVRNMIMGLQKNSKLSLILIIGSTDNRPLRRELKAKFESNAGLGQSRANEVKKMLGELNVTSLPLNVGPSYTLQQRMSGNDVASNIARQSDRLVKICIFGMTKRP